MTSQPELAFEPVPHPPPPVRSERVPAAPDAKAVWIDGAWRWRGRQWSWILGRWVVPQAGARFSPSALRRSASGALLMADGQWYDAVGQPIAEPKPLAHAIADEGDAIDQQGRINRVGRNTTVLDDAPARPSRECELGAHR